MPTFTGITIGFDSPEYNVTEGTNDTVEVCFSSHEGSLMSSSVELIVDISPTATSTGKFNTHNMHTSMKMCLLYITAKLTEDYQLPANPQQIVLNTAQTSDCFNVTIVDDPNDEPTECVTLMAVVSSANIINYTVSEEETQICIRDNDGGLYLNMRVCGQRVMI